MELASIDKDRIPRHIAVIMDGNGRWAQQRGLPHNAGHEAGADSVRAMLKSCRELQRVEVLSLYAFSTENWRRSRREVNALFRLLGKYVASELDSIHKENIQVRISGRREGLTSKTLADLDRCVETTKDNTAMIVNVALNYGGRAELADAARSIAEDVAAGRLTPEDVDETCVAAHLYQPDLPDPDMLIRTSGELRLSNFMLWQLSYAELIVTDTLWPDFRKEHLYEAIAQFQGRSRRYGGR